MVEKTMSSSQTPTVAAYVKLKAKLPPAMSSVVRRVFSSSERV